MKKTWTNEQWRQWAAEHNRRRTLGTINRDLPEWAKPAAIFLLGFLATYIVLSIGLAQT